MHHRAALTRVASIVFLGIVPIVAVIVMFQVGWSSDSLAIDFHNEIYPEAKLLLHGTNPFPGPAADLSRGSNYIWPPFVGYVVAPLTLLPAGGADIAAAALSLIAFVAALWIVGVRDWRVYGASLLWPPVVGEARTAHLTLVLCLLLAVAWRTRDRFPAVGITVGVALALKFFLWPLVHLACGVAAVARRRDRRRSSPPPRSYSCCRSSRCASTRTSCAGSGRPSTRTASLRSGSWRSWGHRIASRTSSQP